MFLGSSTNSIAALFPGSFSLEALPLPRPWFSLALQLRDGHFTHQGCCVEPIDHLWTGPRVPRQLQRVDAGAIEQSEHDAAVTQAVDGPGIALRAHLDAQQILQSIKLVLQQL